MKDFVQIRLPEGATPDDIDDLFACHAYGDDFVRALDLRPEDPADAVRFDEWLPLAIAHGQGSVVVGYRVFFLASDFTFTQWADREVRGHRVGDTLVFKRVGRDV